MKTLTLSQPVNRRDFLKLTGLAGGGLVLGFYYKSAGSANAQVVNASQGIDGRLNAYIKISTNNVITLTSKRPEMGQGVKTSLPMVIAEQLAWMPEVPILRRPVPWVEPYVPLPVEPITPVPAGTSCIEVEREAVVAPALVPEWSLLPSFAQEAVVTPALVSQMSCAPATGCWEEIG